MWRRGLTSRLENNKKIVLNPIRSADAERVQDIAQGYDAFQLVHIRTAHYWQEFDVVCTHAFEGQIKPLIRVDVRKIKHAH